MSVLIMIMLSTGVAVYFVESRIPQSPIESLSDAFWWLLVTISTVGYGDIVPKSSFGKFLGSVTIVVGVAFFTVVTGSIASLLVEMRLKEQRGLGKVRERNHIVILGKNENLPKLLENLANIGVKEVVLVADMEEEEFETLKEPFPEMSMRYVRGDFTKDQVLRRAAVKTSAVVVILADTAKGLEADEKTLIAILALRSINPTVRVIAEVVKEDKMKHILRAGADEVVGYGEFNAAMVGSYVLSPALHTFLTKLLKEGKFGIQNLPQSYVGRTFREIFEEYRKEKGVMIVGIVSERRKIAIEDILTGDEAIDDFLKKKLGEAEMDLFGEEKEYNVNLNPPDEYVISENDTMVVFMR
ncbi:MAG: NAD-binding protein [Thermotogae bacterium]|nr:NAD-binding protein [Thermotogota bacterium]